MQASVHSADMAKHARTEEASNRIITLCSLPRDILGNIIRLLGFKDKCSLELVGRDLHAILGNPTSTEGLWGTCVLMPCLKLEDRFDSKEDIMRWLTKRLPGFTHLICATPWNYDSHDRRYRHSETSDTGAVASWLVLQLPKLSASMSAGCKLSLTIGSDVATKLLRLNTNHRRIQDDFWSAVSETLTKLVVILGPACEALRMDVLNQLTNLTSLNIRMEDWRLEVVRSYGRSYALSLPGLKSLHVTCLAAMGLTLLCPVLRSLTFEQCYIAGDLSLQAPLEDFTMRGISAPQMRKAFPVSSLLGLTSLHCQLPNSMRADLLYGALPLMSGLRKLDLVLDYGQLPPKDGQLPPLLPASLLMVRYILNSGSELSPVDLQRFSDACQLPELQSMTLHCCEGWDPEDDVWRSLMDIKAKSNVEVILSEAWIDEYSFP